jgi:hypothetical protein
MAIPATLRAAAALIAVEAAVEAIVIAHRSDLTPGFRVMLIAFLSLKWVFAVGALRLRPGPVLGLFLLEGTSAVAALGAVHAPPLARLALAGSAVVACTLLGRSLHAFPSPDIPRP